MRRRETHRSGTTGSEGDPASVEAIREFFPIGLVNGETRDQDMFVIPRRSTFAWVRIASFASASCRLPAT